MITVDPNQIEALLPYPVLIDALRENFRCRATVPQRHHHNYPVPDAGSPSTLLLMPAWQDGANTGVKIVTVTPDNASRNMPTVQGLYILFDGQTGTPLLLVDAKRLTLKRTAAASALAASYLVRKDAATMLMIGTGALCCELIRAHAAVRDIRKVWVFGRNVTKAEAIAEAMHHEFDISPVQRIKEVSAKADLVSVATLSQTPLVLGADISPGTHVDLVGSFRHDMREADDALIQKAAVFIDSQAAMHESGDIKIPLATGVISEKDIQGDLFTLCDATCKGRQTADRITLFKSVGHALEDLTAANLILSGIQQQGEKLTV